MSTAKFNSGSSNSFNKKLSEFGVMQLAEVVYVGKLPVTQTDPAKKNVDSTFNSDPYIVKCRIIGSNYDNAIANVVDLPNCHPLLPRFNAVIPKIGETVLVFMFNEQEMYTDRFYIGPIISNSSKLNQQTKFDGSTQNLSTAILSPQKDLSKIESARGIYSEYDTDNTLSLEGRNNADIVFKNSEVLIRGGKFIENDPTTFNQFNPAYIQIKSGFQITEGENTKSISVNNIVANKINLLTYDGGNPQFNLTERDLKNGTTPYITDEELETILEEAHPLVFGDILLEYLVAFRKAFQSHAHNKMGANPPTDRVDISNAVETFENLAPKLESIMLSKNIKIN